MDQAKAIINLKEGVIQLEGPVEFVRQYLDLYRTAISGLAVATHPAVSTLLTKEVPAHAALPIHRRRVPTKRISCADAVRGEIETGFFGEPKSIHQVKQRLLEKGVTCKDNAVRMSLKRLAQKGILAPLKKGRTIRYRHSS